MFSASDIQINPARLNAATPVLFGLLTDETLFVMRVAKSQVIPARACPLRHRVRLAQRFVGVTNPLFRFRERRFAGASRFVIIKWWRNNRQFIFTERAVLPILPNNGERFAPIALSREQPIAQFVIDRPFAEAAFLQPCCDRLLLFRPLFTVDEGGFNGTSFPA